MRPNNRRRHGDSFIPQPTPDRAQFSSRDSDASFASSRPSTIGAGRSSELYTDRGQQASAVRSINAYLSSHSFPLSLKHPAIPSAKDITKVLEFLLQQLDYPSTKLEDDLFVLLKLLNCPYKVNKSSLRAPNTPHNWPSFLAIIHWLVQLAQYEEHLAQNSRSFLDNNGMLQYVFDSYMMYMQGDDDSVAALDGEFKEKLEKQRDSVLENIKSLEAEFNGLASKAEALKSGKTQKEMLEERRSLLEKDVTKLHAIIANHKQGTEYVEKILEEKRKALEAKVEEKKRIDQENEELEKRIGEQSFNARDADRMKRELQAVERDVEEAETERNAWEDKTWNLNATIQDKFKELEALAMECNQAARRLKLGNSFQYALNANGASPVDVMGIDYKSIVKPQLQSVADDIKRSSMNKVEEYVSLQRDSSELTAKVDEKRNQIATLQSRCDEEAALIDRFRKETEEYAQRYAMEAQKLLDEVQVETHNMDVLDKEAAEFLEASKQKLEEEIEQSENEIQRRARELFEVVDTVSTFKEQMESKISEMKSKLAATVDRIAARYKDPIP